MDYHFVWIVPAGLMLASFLAIIVPASRATGIDPVIARANELKPLVRQEELSSGIFSLRCGKILRNDFVDVREPDGCQDRATRPRSVLQRLRNYIAKQQPPAICCLLHPRSVRIARVIGWTLYQVGSVRGCEENLNAVNPPLS
jgi:hypothetical protein